MSIFAWVDYDDEQRRRMNEIIKLFTESDARDELGLGVIRDSLSDLFFPGTSTIQTRVRYMFFIPWLFMELEKRRVPGEKFKDKAEKAERGLIEHLKSLKDEWGVFGRVKDDVQRLPSNVYWHGLGEWGIRLFEGSSEEYFRGIERFYEINRLYRGEEDEVLENEGLYNWHLGIINPPKNFPQDITLDLTVEEALYLQERIKIKQPNSLLAALLDAPKSIEAEEIWQYPYPNLFTREQKVWIENAQIFSMVMNGAAILYNIYISDLTKKDGIAKGEKWSAQYRTDYQSWISDVKRHSELVKNWDLDGFWGIANIKAKGEYLAAKKFISAWVSKVRENEDLEALIADAGVRKLITERENALKRDRSRLSSAQVRRRWNGDVGSGTRPYNFRWPIAKNFLNEIFKGMENNA